MTELIWLLPIGVAAGAVGALIGAGGGFILVPLLILLYPDLPAETITGISLAVVFANALSGSAIYGKMKRIDVKTGLVFGLCTIPGAIAGSLVVGFFSRDLFDLVFGTLLMILGPVLFFLPQKPPAESIPIHPKKGYVFRVLTDAEGKRYAYSFSMKVGACFSGLIGFISSLLGIGGGILHVPVMVRFLGIPVHVATATSIFSLAFMSMAGTLVHGYYGDIRDVIPETMWLVLGVLVGAQIGAQTSQHLHGNTILRILALGLALTGLRILLG